MFTPGLGVNDRRFREMPIRDRWIAFFLKTATGDRRIRMLLTPVGGMVFCGFTCLFAVAALVVDRALGLPRLLPGGMRLLAAVPVLLPGAFVTGWSGLHFFRMKGTPVPVNPPPGLVDTGPYRYVRNPMLTGVFLMLFGVGLGIGSASLVFFFTPLYIAFHVWELKNIEEPELEARLGDAYAAYRQKTPMFLPGLKPGKKFFR